jgi:hypothetical protein
MAAKLTLDSIHFIRFNSFHECGIQFELTSHECVRRTNLSGIAHARPPSFEPPYFRLPSFQITSPAAIRNTQYVVQEVDGWTFLPFVPLLQCTLDYLPNEKACCIQRWSGRSVKRYKSRAGHGLGKCSERTTSSFVKRALCH